MKRFFQIILMILTDLLVWSMIIGTFLFLFTSESTREHGHLFTSIVGMFVYIVIDGLRLKYLDIKQYLEDSEKEESWI